MIANRKILVVEDDNLLRSLVASKLIDEDFEVAQAHDAATALKLAADFDPDIALLDIDLGQGPNGLDVAAYLTANHPGIAIVFLTNVPEPRVISRENSQIPKGAAYLLKDRITNTSLLNEAIEAAIRERVTVKLRDDKNATNAFSKLSKAQIQVVQKIAMGMTNAQIAKERGTTVRSVELLINRVMAILGGSGDDSPMQARVLIAREYYKLAGLPHKPEA